MDTPVIPALSCGALYLGSGEAALRQFSNTLFALALGCALMMKPFAVQIGLIWIAVFSVLLTMILTNFMWVRSTGIAGISGLSLVYTRLEGSSLPGTILTVITAALLSSAVLLAIFADLSVLKQGEKNQHEV